MHITSVNIQHCPSLSFARSRKPGTHTSSPPFFVTPVFITYIVALELITNARIITLAPSTAGTCAILFATTSLSGLGIAIGVNTGARSFEDYLISLNEELSIIEGNLIVKFEDSQSKNSSP